jgi:hypothetical protein
VNRISLIPFVLLLVFQVGKTQVEFGIKAGISSYQLGEKPLSEWIGNTKFTTHFTTADYGHHFGLYSRLRIAAVYIEPALLFQSGSFSHTFEEYSEAGVITVVKNERYNQVNVPLLIGIKAGFFRLQTGPVMNFMISKTSDLWNFEEYSEKVRTFTYGIQAGMGIDIWRFRFDVMYENNLRNLGNEITIGGNNYSLNPNPSRFIFTLGYKF